DPVLRRAEAQAALVIELDLACGRGAEHPATVRADRERARVNLAQRARLGGAHRVHGVDERAHTVPDRRTHDLAPEPRAGQATRVRESLDACAAIGAQEVRVSDP